MTFAREKRTGSEICAKCGTENLEELTWKRSKTALGKLPLLCSNCAKALSRDIKEFVSNWLDDTKTQS